MSDAPKNEAFRKRGGASFPQIDLDTAEKYAKRLASKTHSGSLSVEMLWKGVFDSAGGRGVTRLSSCRQYGFVLGENKAIEASETAKKLVAATQDQRKLIFQDAYLKATVFLKVYTAFKGDLRTRAEIKQEAQRFNVHPENLDKCADFLISAGRQAELILDKGDRFEFLERSAGTTPMSQAESSSSNSSEDEVVDDARPDDVDDLADHEGDGTLPNQLKKVERNTGTNVALSISIDSTMDADKLAKMLKLLRDNNLL